MLSKIVLIFSPIYLSFMKPFPNWSFAITCGSTLLIHVVTTPASSLYSKFKRVIGLQFSIKYLSLLFVERSVMIPCFLVAVSSPV